MIKRRIGNDIKLVWGIVRSNGTPVDLSNVSDIKVWVKPDKFDKVYPQEFTIEENKIKLQFTATEQFILGSYNLYVKYTEEDETIETGIATHTLDYKGAFNLVSSSSRIDTDEELEIFVNSVLNYFTYNDLSEDQKNELAEIIARYYEGDFTLNATWGDIIGNIVEQLDLMVYLNEKVDIVEGKQLSTEDFTSELKDKLDNIEANANKYKLPSDVVQDENYVHTDNNFTNEEKQKLSELENYNDSNILSELGKKVDKVSGKQLSTEDFTTALKNKLESLENFDVSSIMGLLDNKVDKVSGKQLSTNDFSNNYKEKLDSIEAGANKFVLPSDVVQDSEYVHTDNNYTNQDKQKLEGLINYDDTEIQYKVDNKVDKIEGKGLSTEDFSTALKSKLDNIEEGATNFVLPDDVVQDENYVHTDNNFTTSEKDKLAGLENYDDSNILSELNDKVNKVSGKGLSTEDFTSELKDKLVNLEGTHFKGQFTSLSSLKSNITNPNIGDYAYVDLGSNEDVVKYIWDNSDDNWVLQQGESAEMTPAQIKSAYESNVDTNAFTDVEKNKLAEIESNAQRNVKSDWNSTSGDSEILNKPTLGSISSKNKIDISDINTSGTASQNTILHGDGSWKTVGSGSVNWGGIGGNINSQTDLTNKLNGKVDNDRVKTDVPENAVFTDTTYPEISELEIVDGTNPALRVVSGRRIGYILNRVQNWISNLTKTDIGLSNVTNDKQATKEEFDYHTGNNTVHITQNERNTWNAKGSSNLVLGNVNTSAYRGDRGEIAYNHSQSQHAPINAQKNSDITKAEIEAKLTGDISSHTHSDYVDKAIYKASTFNDNVIDLTNPLGAFRVSNAISTPTYQISSNKVSGAWAKILINVSSEPTVSGANKLEGSEFEANTNMYLYVSYDGVRVEYYFAKI